MFASNANNLTYSSDDIATMEFSLSKDALYHAISVNDN